MQRVSPKTRLSPHFRLLPFALEPHRGDRLLQTSVLIFAWKYIFQEPVSRSFPKNVLRVKQNNFTKSRAVFFSTTHDTIYIIERCFCFLPWPSCDVKRSRLEFAPLQKSKTQMPLKDSFHFQEPPFRQGKSPRTTHRGFLASFENLKEPGGPKLSPGELRRTALSD